MKKFILFSLMAAFFQGFSASAAWYRGNTHCHTVICGHADSTPDQVAAWYHDRGYNFLILSEHNHFIDPSTVTLPEPRRKDFILIPGQEVTGKKTIHTTAMNTKGVVPWQFDHPEPSHIIQNHVDGVHHAGGHAILNHPNFHYAVSADDMKSVNGLQMFELYNGHPKVNNDGNAEHPSTEAIWDALLSAGKRMYGVSSDDAHHFQKHGPNLSNPGRGWVMVEADRLEPARITEALHEGHFYASSGVYLKRCLRSAEKYEVVVDRERTEAEIDRYQTPGKKLKTGTPGYRIDFIGPGGKLLERVTGTKAGFNPAGTEAYVRCRVSYTRKVKDGAFEAWYAWGQPVFRGGDGS